MDKKKKMICRAMMVLSILLSAVTLNAQSVSEVQFCGREYKYTEGEDSITLFFNLINEEGERLGEVTNDALNEYLVVKENGKIIKNKDAEIKYFKSGQRIPDDYTFSVLVDLSIPQEFKQSIYKAIGDLVNSAADGSVFVSCLGNEVTSSISVTRENYSTLQDIFNGQTDKKAFYDGVLAKLVEFSKTPHEKEESLKIESDYTRNEIIANRAEANPDKNILFLFVDGSKVYSGLNVFSIDVTKYQKSLEHIVPDVYALYYSDTENVGIINTLQAICEPRDNDGTIIDSRRGEYMPSTDMNEILKKFEEIVNDTMYDYSFKYHVDKDKTYSGIVSYSAMWKADAVGEEKFSIGSAERPWPVRQETNADVARKLLYALLVTLCTIAFFFTIVKILIPYIRFKSFKIKYYKKYVPEMNVSRRICHYCKQDINPGQYIVTKCKHYMHVFCWEQNGYKCAEYGQNCKTGIQSHVDWKHLFTLSALKDCSQTISGIVAGFISWILYELLGRGLFNGLSTKFVDVFYGNITEVQTLHLDCVNKTSAFLTIGLLLGFFLSFIFRYNDEYKRKDAKVWGKIIGLSLLTGVIGMLVFAVGAIILCLILATIDSTYVPWFCSLPAYILFSISVSLALTIKSTIPVKSALLGGLCSSLIGFVVLCFSSLNTSSNAWVNMLLDFIIYGGGLGASLVTVRLLAERYFLVIQNGVRAGQKIPIHKWMNAVGGGNKVTIGMAGECEIQMNWEKNNRVAQEHVQLYIDYDKQLPMLKPLDTGVIFNTRAELPVGISSALSNGDNFKIGDTIFVYQETE